MPFELSDDYYGPSRLHDDAVTALERLADCLEIDQTTCETHSLVTVGNFHGPEVFEAVAIYLVSAIAQTIEANLEIRAALFDEETLFRDLEEDVINVIGVSAVPDEFKIMVRDPWMWEGISHMFMHLSRLESSLHPSGTVLAKTSIKHDVHDHGLDVIAIYDGDTIGISAGECKAYFQDPVRGIRDASEKLREVDSKDRDIEIRAVVSLLRGALDEDTKRRLSGAFWRDERSYIPFIFCDEEYSCNWTRKRKALERLGVPTSRKFLLPLSLVSAREKFDEICSIMRSYAAIEE